MKKTLFPLYVICILKCTAVSARLNFDYESVKEYKILERSKSCSIVELTDKNGVTILNVIAALSTSFLPEIVEGLCKRAVGDPDVCNAVYDVTSTLVSFRGERIYRGLTRGVSRTISWVADRGHYRSKATVETNSYLIATKIKEVFEYYRERCISGMGIPWESIDFSPKEDNSYVSDKRFVTIYNKADRPVDFQLSADGDYYWDVYSLIQGRFNSYSFLDSEDPRGKTEGYIRITSYGNENVYKIHANQSYNIKWSGFAYEVYHYRDNIHVSEDYKMIYFKNECSRSIKLLVRFVNLDGEWVNRGWYRIDPDASARIDKTRSGHIFYYAEDGEVAWNGQSHFYFNGTLYPFDRWEFTKNGSQKKVKRLICD